MRVTRGPPTDPSNLEHQPIEPLGRRDVHDHVAEAEGGLAGALHDQDRLPDLGSAQGHEAHARVLRKVRDVAVDGGALLDLAPEGRRAQQLHSRVALLEGVDVEPMESVGDDQERGRAERLEAGHRVLSQRNRVVEHEAAVRAPGDEHPARHVATRQRALDRAQAWAQLDERAMRENGPGARRLHFIFCPDRSSHIRAPLEST